MPLGRIKNGNIRENTYAEGLVKRVYGTYKKESSLKILEEEDGPAELRKFSFQKSGRRAKDRSCLYCHE